MMRSCPIGTLGNELQEDDDLTRQALCLILDLMLARLESFFSREKMAGRLPSTVDVEQVANLCVALIQGAMLIGKIRRNCHSTEVVFEDLLRHLKCYATVPTVTRRGDRKQRRRSTLPEPPPPTTVVMLHDLPDGDNSAEDPSC
jgi:Tetracyclin repressor-like, C-terminal domain